MHKSNLPERATSYDVDQRQWDQPEESEHIFLATSKVSSQTSVPLDCASLMDGIIGPTRYDRFNLESDPAFTTYLDTSLENSRPNEEISSQHPHFRPRRPDSQEVGMLGKFKNHLSKGTASSGDNPRLPEATEKDHESITSKDDMRSAQPKTPMAAARNPTVRLLFARAALQERVLTTIAVCVAALQGATVPVANWLLGHTFNVFTVYALNPGSSQSKETFRSGVAQSSLGFLGLAAAAAVLEWFVVLLWTRNAERIVKRTSGQLLQSLQNNSMSWFDRKNEGSAGIMARLSADLEEIRAGSNQNLGHTIQYLTAFLSTLILALVKSWSLTLVILASIPLIVLVTVITDIKGRPLMSLERNAHSDSGTAVESSLLNIKTVKVFEGQSAEKSKFNDQIGNACDLYSRLQYVWASRQGICQFLLLSMFVQGFWFGTYLVKNGKLDAGTVLTVFWSCVTAATYLQQCMPLTIYLSKAKIAIARILTALESDPEERATGSKMPGIRPLEASKGDFELQNISFCYPSRPDDEVLKNVSIFIPSGDTTYLVGASGSGKSTIGQILLKMYEPTDGRILMGNQNHSHLDSQWVRRQIAYVQQETVLFEDTIVKNIMLGSHTIHADPVIAVQKACKVALIHDYIRDLPQGYETMLGTNGLCLSGGQRQRIALARAIFRDSPLLILDEATSALDSTTRDLVHEAVRLQRKGKTTLIITHDLSQVNDDSFVYLVKEGRIVEQGYRTDMMQKTESEFRNLAELQTRSAVFGEKRNGDSERSLPQNLSIRSAVSASYLQPLYTLRPESIVLPIRDAEELMIPEIQDLDEKGKSAAQRRTKVRRNPQQTSTIIDVDAQDKLIPVMELARSYLPFLHNPVLMGIGLCASISNGVVTPVFSYLLSHLLANLSYSAGGDAVRTTYSPHSATYWSVLVLAVAAADGITAFSRYLFLELASAIWIYRIRQRTFDLIMHQDQTWFDSEKNKVARLATLMMKDSENMRAIIGQQIGSVTTVAVMIAIGILWSLISGWELTLAGLALAPLYAVVTLIQGKIMLKVERENKRLSDTVALRIYELVSAFKTIRSLSLEEIFASKIHEQVNLAYTRAARNALKTGIGQACGEFLQYSGRAFLFYIGMLLIVSGRYDLTKMLQVFALITFAIVTASTIITTLPGFSKGRKAANDLHRLLKLQATGHEDQGSLQTLIKGHINFEKVTFAYDQSAGNVLNQISFTVRAGESVALVGKSGGGKSTIGSLLQRLYHFDSGKISIDGESISSYATTNLRAQIGVVSQHTTLFHVSIADNISYGLSESTLRTITEYQGSPEQHDARHCEEGGVIYEAAKQAQILPWILSLPEQFQTKLGQDILHKMSGGQAQRLQLARIFLRMPLLKVLILDECTSALDSANSNAILSAIFSRKDHKSSVKPTVLIITHKVDAMKQTDRVLLLDRGMVVEEGPFASLMDQTSTGALRQLITAGAW